MGSIYGEYRNPRSKNNFVSIIDKVFWNKLEFIDYILNTLIFYENSYITATNLGFDFFALFENTDVIENFLLTIRGSNIIQAKYKSEERNNIIKFIDSMNFSKLSVKEMGKIIGLSKLPSPTCFKRKPKNLAERIELEKYNKIDTRITFEFMKMLQKGFNDLNCCMKMTIASTSMDLFKRNYLDRTLHQNENTIKTLLKGYYGARNEVLKRGKVDFLELKYYDYNSLYPDVMRNKYPNPNFEKYLKKGYYDLLENDGYEGLMNVTVKINKDINLPYLPYRRFNNEKEKTGGYKLIFPTGIFSGYYTFYELRKALKLGYEILKFGECIYYTKTFKPFEDYVIHLFTKRYKYKINKSPLEQVVKLHLNSLYGKFAQKYDNNEQIYHINSLTGEQFENFIKNKAFKSMVRGDYIYVTRKKATYIPTFIIPIFSIYTTAYGRTKLYEKIIDIGVDNVYYYDTDSIITDKILKTDDFQLGELKLEYSILKGKIVAPKVYSFEAEISMDIGKKNPIKEEIDIIKKITKFIKVKGIPKLKSLKEFDNLIENKKVVYEKFVKFKEANSRDLKYNQIIMIEKNFKFEDDKRKWDKPFKPEELQTSSPIHIIENID